MKSAVIVFPGSNCDRDLAIALREVSGEAPAMIWHRETELPQGLDLIAVPGGFSYGDYLLKVENSQSAFTSRYQAGEAITIPVAHHDGNYTADEETLDRLEGEGRVVFRYQDSVNGSARDIAGIVNATGNVLGMMPHPERMIEPAHGGNDGRRLFEGLIEALSGPIRAFRLSGQ